MGMKPALFIEVQDSRSIVLLGLVHVQPTLDSIHILLNLTGID